MRKLFFANVYRLIINKAFWMTVILMVGLEIMLNFMISGDNIPMDLTIFLSAQGIGILSSVFYSLFLGTEYSEGTIRNKVIIGHKRKNIYISSFLSGCFAITIIYLAGVLTGMMIGFLLFEPFYQSLDQILLAILIGWLASLSYISIFNLIGMLSVSKARTSILCILITFLLIFVGSICSRLFVYGDNSIYEFLYEINPVGQMIHALTMDVPSPIKFILYPISLSSLLVVIGIYFFNKKDLK